MALIILILWRRGAKPFRRMMKIMLIMEMIMVMVLMMSLMILILWRRGAKAF